VWAGEKGSATEQHQHTEVLRRDSREVARARRVVTGLLTDWGLPEEVPPFELAVSELVSNALLHGSGEIQVDLRCEDDGRVRLAVGDEGRGAAPVPRVDERRIGGWGLRFVEQLAESWGSERHEWGTLVWMVKRAALGSGKGGGALAW